MGKKVGKRSIAQMKYHLYQKVLNRNTFPAFSAMFNAGVESVLPTTLENIQIPPGLNTKPNIEITVLSAVKIVTKSNCVILFGLNSGIKTAKSKGV